MEVTDHAIAHTRTPLQAGEKWKTKGGERSDVRWWGVSA